LKNGKTFGDNEFAAQHFSGTVIVWQETGDPTILAFLIPAKPAIGNRFRANVLEAPQDRVSIGDAEFPA
jgi:hypothetical protein